MEENLISKKELLALTGISYGSLYRWKRKQLIPEEWFIKKSTFTGPETFFPRENILERIARIKEMKEDLSLDDLAETFSASPIAMSTTLEELLARGVITGAAAGLPQAQEGEKLDFYGALYLCLCDDLLAEGTVSLPEAGSVLAHLLADFRQFDQPPLLRVCRKMGVAFSLLSDKKARVSAGGGVKLVAEVDTAGFYEKLKVHWGEDK